MSIALDIGTSRLRSLRWEDDELVGRSVPAAFALIADDPASRSLLTRAEVDFADGEGELALIGDAAVEHAAAFRTPLLRILPNGRVPTDDPPARQILGMLVESLLPEPSVPRAQCGLILPAAATIDVGSREFLSRLVWMRGYEPVLLSTSHAVALATLSKEGFTGVALSFGAGGCSIGLIHRGRELATVSEPRGTDWIDTQVATAERCYTHDAAGQRYLDLESARHRRESTTIPLARPTTEFVARVADLTREVLLETLSQFCRALTDQRLGPFTGPLPLVCTGGGTRAAGFTGLMTSVLANANLPISVGPVRLAPHDEYLVARGGLIHAELETTCSAVA